MPSSLRLGALLFAAVSADDTSLMQDVKKSASSKRDGKHMSALMESAANMLKNGATPDVVEFAQETLDEIAGVVIPAIVDESRVQQAQVVDNYRRMTHLIDVDLAGWKQEIFQWSSEVETASSVHHICRDEEKIKCDGKRSCEMELYRLWTTWVGEETDLRDIHNSIEGHFCPPGANGTTHTFRETSVPWMNSYMSQKVEVDVAETNYDTHRPICIVNHNLLDSQSAVCNAAQSDLETKACNEARAVHQTLSDFERQYTVIDEEWNARWQNVRSDEIMRHREYRQIKVVECLLSRIHELNGEPCDQETDQANSEMSHCHAEGANIRVCDFYAENDPGTAAIASLTGARYETRDEDGVHIEGNFICPSDNLLCLVGHEAWKYLHFESNSPSQGSICIVYPEKPERPPHCPGDEPCLPLVPPHPCDPLWTTHEVSPLPVVPQEPFSATNPGCNQYPPCSACDLSDFAQFDHAAGDHSRSEHDYTAVETYTVDGCVGTDAVAGEHPLTMHSDAGHTADVRCCSLDGTSCQSQHLEGGADYYHNGNLHSQDCVDGVSHAQAEAVCAAGGMRLCNSHEVQQCCGTGCYHDHHSIWVVDRYHDHSLD